jgi:hypothetical protein
MSLSDRESRMPALVGRPLRFARRAVGYALKHEFQRQFDELRALILESNAYTTRQLLDVEALLERRSGNTDGQRAVDLSSSRGLAVMYAVRALGELPPGARVLDLAPASTALAFALAALGYQVTAVSSGDPGYRHPNLTAYSPGDDQLEGPFGAIVAVFPEEPAALDLVPNLTARGTRLVAAVELPVPPDLDRSLPVGSRPPAGWRIKNRTLAEAGPDGSWKLVKRHSPDRPAVALVTATSV